MGEKVNEKEDEKVRERRRQEERRGDKSRQDHLSTVYLSSTIALRQMLQSS